MAWQSHADLPPVATAAEGGWNIRGYHATACFSPSGLAVVTAFAHVAAPPVAELSLF